MPYPLNLKEKAIILRNQGYSIKEIATSLNVPVSTSSSWVSKVILSLENKELLAQKKILGQRKSSIVIREKTRQRKMISDIEAKSLIDSINFNSKLDTLLCSILYWAEGSKNCSNVGFTNSDPKMISTFLKQLRSAFDIDESKFHCLIHIHEYHNDIEEKLFWSKVTNIPVNQFFKSYHKPHTGKRKKPNYHGTISVRYYDSKIAVKINSIYNMYVQSLGV